MLEVDITLKRGEFDLQMKFAVADGNVSSLFGVSGCGKTTTANLIAGLLTPDAGRVVIRDRIVFDSSSNVNIPVEHRGIGYVFQNPRLFPHLNVSNNLVYGLRRTRHTHYIDYEAVVKLLDLHPLLKRRPSQLSGGEQQRVAIGRALLSQPTLLLLDEPLTSLDIARRSELLPYLERLRDSLKTTMLYVSHQFDEVLRLATHVVLMNKGHCLAQGSLNQLSLHPALSTILNEDSIGAVIDSKVLSINSDTGLAQLAIGNGVINIDAADLILNERVRVQLLARDLILSLDAAPRLSIRNNLAGTVTRIINDSGNTALVQVDVGGMTIMAHVTSSAAREMALEVGTQLWVLIKAITLRGHVFKSPQIEWPS